jgi:outer membrane protein TolC
VMRAAGAVLLCLLVPARHAGAQSSAAPQAQIPAPPKMEFDEAIKQAVAKNPTLIRAATSITRADLLLQESRLVLFPIVTGTIVNSTLDGARGFAGGVTQPQNQSTFAGNVSYPVLAPARWAQIQQARDQIVVAEAATAEVRQQVSVAAAQAYLAVIAARRQVDVTARALESARAHLDYATKRFEGGAGSRLNQLRAAQVASSDEARLEAIFNALRTAQEALGVLVVADGPIDAGADPVFDEAGTLDESAWRAARPDIITQAAIQRAAERVVRDSKLDWFPTVNASYDPSYVTPSGLFAPSGTWRFTLSSTYLFFDGGSRRLARRNRELTLEQSKIVMSEIEIQARSEVRLAQETVRSRQRALESARRAAQQAAEVVTITTTAFEVGATTNLEVIDAQREARDTDTVAAIAEDALNRARLELLVALGRFK